MSEIVAYGTAVVIVAGRRSAAQRSPRRRRPRSSSAVSIARRIVVGAIGVMLLLAGIAVAACWPRRRLSGRCSCSSRAP